MDMYQTLANEDQLRNNLQYQVGHFLILMVHTATENAYTFLNKTAVTLLMWLLIWLYRFAAIESLAVAVKLGENFNGPIC